ncbi:MAG: FAD-dependent monooxygenase [Desulfobacterota bacterium]|nr:FAD-dependent monooxygenase [Thermodesulfobacteriota bacterium]
MVYDLAIVGAGPAGLGAACTAATYGLSTALIERKKQLTPLTRSCSEGLLYEESYYGESVHVDRDRGCFVFSPSGFTLRYTGPVREIPYFDNVSYRGSRMHIIRDDGKPIHLVFDKARYLEENLADAQAHGVAFFPDRTVIDWESRGDTVVIHTSRETFSARYLIAADGHNSLCARRAGFNKEREFYGTLTAVCWHIEGPDPGEEGHVHLLEGSDDPTVFCMCPRVTPGQWSITISGFALSPNYEARYEHVTTRSVLAPLFKPQLRVIRKLACVLNLFYPISKPCTITMCIVGDGAWFGQTSNSHAALTGIQAVNCIAKALGSKCSWEEAVEHYNGWWQRRFYTTWQEPGVNVFEFLTREEIDELFSCLPKAIPGSMEPGKAKRLMGTLFQHIGTVLQEKNPHLFERILAVQQQPLERIRGEKQNRGIAVRTLMRTSELNQEVL